MLCEPSGAGETDGSACIIIVLLLVVVSTEWNLESICGGDVEEKATLRCDLGRQGFRTTHVVPAHFEMKEGEYELGRKGKV